MPELPEFDHRRSDQFLNLQVDLEGIFLWLTERLQEQGLSAADVTWAASDRLSSQLERARGPTFDEHGYAPPVEQCSEAELVMWFGSNSQRAALLERIIDWIRLARSVDARRLLIDGSFVTAKEIPADVDCAILLPEDFSQRVASGDAAAMGLFRSILTRQPQELLYAEVEEDWWGWVEFFGRTREASGRRKGLFEVVL